MTCCPYLYRVDVGNDDDIPVWRQTGQVGKTRVNKEHNKEEAIKQGQKSKQADEAGSSLEFILILGGK